MEDAIGKRQGGDDGDRPDEGESGQRVQRDDLTRIGKAMAMRRFMWLRCTTYSHSVWAMALTARPGAFIDNFASHGPNISGNGAPGVS
jgi:hypothetical protein